MSANNLINYTSRFSSNHTHSFCDFPKRSRSRALCGSTASSVSVDHLRNDRFPRFFSWYHAGKQVEAHGKEPHTLREILQRHVHLHLRCKLKTAMVEEEEWSLPGYSIRHPTFAYQALSFRHYRFEKACKLYLPLPGQSTPALQDNLLREDDQQDRVHRPTVRGPPRPSSNSMHGAPSEPLRVGNSKQPIAHRFAVDVVERAAKELQWRAMGRLSIWVPYYGGHPLEM